MPLGPMAAQEPPERARAVPPALMRQAQTGPEARVGPGQVARAAMVPAAVPEEAVPGAEPRGPPAAAAVRGPAGLEQAGAAVRAVAVASVVPECPFKGRAFTPGLFGFNALLID